MKRLLWLSSIVLLFVLPLPAAVSDLLLGTATVTGSGYLNHQPLSGYAATLGSGDRLETGAHSGAILTISNSDVLVLGENSGVTLVSRPDGVSAELERGRVQVTTKQQRLREVRLAGEAVSVRAAPGAASIYQISRLSDATYIQPGQGTVSIYRDGLSDPTEVPQGMMSVVGPAGELWQIAQQSPGSPAQQRPSPGAAGGQPAGKLSVTIPADYIIRGPAQMEGAPGEVVFLNDLLRTGPHGRVRFTMEDGSIMTIGSSSQLQVREHNLQTQQTSMEMLYGKMRAQVVKLTVPNARFEIRTATAVCGALGTDFYIEATPTSTRVLVFQGIVRVTPLVAGAIAGITVGAGQMAVSSASSVSSPVAASASQLQSAVTAATATQQAAQATVTGVATATSAATRVAVLTATVVPPATVAAVSIPTLTQNVVSPTKP